MRVTCTPSLFNPVTFVTSCFAVLAPQVMINMADGSYFERRDPYARSTDYDSSWCFVDDESGYEWKVGRGWVVVVDSAAGLAGCSGALLHTL